MKAVVDLQDRRPAWAMPPWVPERIREALPEDAEVVVVDVAADGSGDGAARVHPAVLEAVPDAEVYMGYGVHPAVLQAGRALRWVHSGAAGVAGSLSSELLRSGVVFTNSAGVHAAPIAETVVAMILHFARGFDLAARAQAEGRWDTSGFFAADHPLVEVLGSTVSIVGFGGVGREVAQRVAALGARVLASRRRDIELGPVDLETVGGGSRLHRAARVVRGDAGLSELLAESDFVVLSAPHTASTDALLDARALRRLKPGAVLVNVARGGLVDVDALVEALRERRLRGAALDVFHVEPLPEGHPLWTLPNVLLTPHVSAVSGAFWTRETDLIVENIGRFVEGRSLRNEVDVVAGY